MGKRVAVLDPDGKFATVDEADVPNLPLGARALTPKEIAAKESDEAYAQKSTAEKITGAASMVGPVPFLARAAIKHATGHDEEIVPALPPTVEAYKQGVSTAFTGGLATAAEHEALRALGGDAAAKAYAKNVADVKQAHGTAYGAGMAAGVVGDIASGGALSPLGGAVEGAAARGLSGVASRGVLGRALATGGALAARGAAEGAVIGAANQISEDSLGDRDIAADKVFAAMGLGALTGGVSGGVLGAGGSLAASGARGALSRVLSKGAEAATEAASTAEGTIAKAAAPEQGPLSKLLGGKGDDVAKDIAQDRAFRATGGRKEFVKEANKYLPNGTNDVGEVLLRHGVLSADEGLLRGALSGTPEAMLPKVTAAGDAMGQRLGQITSSSPATIRAGDIGEAIADVVDKYGSKAATKPAADSLAKFGKTLGGTLGITSLEDAVPLQRLLEERKALDRLVFEGAPLDASLQVEIKRELRGKLEGLITKGLDEASGKVPGELAAEYKAIKHDFQALRIARDAIEDSIARGTANRTYSLTDKIIGAAAGAASTVVGGGMLGGMVAGPGAATVSKFVRERGDAAVALLLHKQASMGTLSRTIRTIDEHLDSASRGLLLPPKPQPYSKPAKAEPVRQQAAKAMAEVARLQSDPQALMTSMSRSTEAMHSTAPELAMGIQMRTARALAFLATKMPAAPDPDPLDPHPAPKISDAEAASFVRTYEYVQQPTKFLEDLSRGKLTFEGAEAAQAMMPDVFEDLQKRTLAQLADLKARGKAPPYQQRQMLGVLLNIPATPSQRPDHMAFLQANVQATSQPAPQAQANPPKRPLPTKPQYSPLDRLEKGK